MFNTLIDIQLLRGEVWDPNDQFNPTTFLYLSKSRLGFPMSYVGVLIVFIELRSKMSVPFVDIGGIVDHHCLNFLFVMDIIYRQLFNATFNNTYFSYVVLVSFICVGNLSIWRKVPS